MSEFGFLTASAPNGGAIVPGVTPIIGGAVGQILFQGTGNVVQESANLFWDNTNGRLTIGTSTGTSKINLPDAGTTSSDGIAFGNGANIFKNASSGISLFSGSGTWQFNSAILVLPTNQGTIIRMASGRNLLIDNGTTTFASINGTTGNVLINTTTDAGFRLDVNGTARVQGNVEIGGASATTVSSTYNSTTRNQNRYTNGSSFEFHEGVNERMRIAAGGNVLINTTTDAGFRLDVNGTARVNNTLRVVGSVGYGSNVFEFGVNGGSSANGYIDGFGRWFISNGGTNTIAATIGSSILFLGQNSNSAAIAFSNSSNIIGQWAGTAGSLANTGTSESIILVNNQSSQNLYGITIAGDQVSGQTGSKNLLTLSHWGASGVQTFNNLSTAQTYTLINVNISVSPTQPNKTLRGFYYNPNISGVALLANYAFHSTSGRIRFENLPTSSAGLSAGELWNDAGTLKIV